MGRIFSLEYTIYSRAICGLNPSCSAAWTASLCYPAQAVYSSEFSNSKSIYTGEPLPYQFKPQLSHEGDDILVEVPNEVRIRRFAGRMDSVGNVTGLVRLCFYNSRV